MRRNTKSEGTSRKEARALKPPGPCELCGALGTDVHHKDRDPFNNAPGNLERLCGSCHKLKHYHQPERLRMMRLMETALIDSVRKHSVTGEEFTIICAYVRKKTGISYPKGSRKGGTVAQAKIMTQEALEKLFKAIDSHGSIKYQVMFRLLLYTGVRVFELVGIRLEDVDLRGLRIRIVHSKGGGERYVPIPERFALPLRAYMATPRSGAKYLFESNQKRAYSTEMLRRLLSDFSRNAGIPHVHPHMLRHQLLTHLARNGIADSHLQLISGHVNRDNLAIYQHLSLGDVSDAYQKAVGQFTM